MLRYSLMIALASLSLVCAAQVYRHVDEHGNVTFTDQPPPDAERVEIREPNTLAAPPVIERAPEASPEPQPVEYEVTITAPAPETAIPRGPGNFSVSASVTPGLNSGYQLQLLIDGAEEGEPQRATNWALTNVFRGARQLEVIVIDERGKELARSPAVTVYVFRPSSNF